MSTVGTVESLWRYPVKSMRGEECDAIFAGFAGVYGDRLFAFSSSANRAGFPYFTAREQQQMLRMRPRFRYPEKMRAPLNLAEAQAIGAGATPVYANREDLTVEVETPDNRTLAIDDPALIALLREGTAEQHQLSLLRSERALTDCRPLSIISRQTIQCIEDEIGAACDPRRFRANIYLDLAPAGGFAEDEFVGRSLRLGEKAVVAILQRDTRCVIITFDPDTGAKSPPVLKNVAQAHAGKAGVYAAVLVEGMIRRGDVVKLLA